MAQEKIVNYVIVKSRGSLFVANHTQSRSSLTEQTLLALYSIFPHSEGRKEGRKEVKTYLRGFILNSQSSKTCSPL